MRLGVTGREGGKEGQRGGERGRCRRGKYEGGLREEGGLNNEGGRGRGERR